MSFVKRSSLYLCFLVFFIQLDDDVFYLIAPLQNIPTTILQFSIKMNELLKKTKNTLTIQIPLLCDYLSGPITLGAYASKHAHSSHRTCNLCIMRCSSFEFYHSKSKQYAIH